MGGSLPLSMMEALACHLLLVGDSRTGSYRHAEHRTIGHIRRRLNENVIFSEYPRNR